MRYDFKITGDVSANSLDNADLVIRDSLGTIIEDEIDGYWASFTAATTGRYYVSIEDGDRYDGAVEGNYVIQARMDDKVRGDTATTATITRTGQTAGTLGEEADSDWYRVNAVEGLTFGWIVTGDGGTNSLHDANLVVRDALGNSLGEVIDGRWIAHTATADGPIYVEVQDGGFYDGLAEGDFRLRSVMTDTIRADNETDAVLLDGQTLNGAIDVYGDADWYAFTAVAGRVYDFSMTGVGSSGAISRTQLPLRDSAGNIIDFDDGSPFAGFNWTATSSGKFYVVATAPNYQDPNKGSGKFTLSVLSNSATLRGTNDGEKLTGGSGNTMLLGFGGDDDLDGGAGNDRLNGSTGDDILRGGDGIDTGLFNGAAAATVDLRSAGRQQTGYGNDQLLSIENLVGGNGADSFTGNGQNNELDGRNGNDTLRGLGGNDIIIGSAGNDLIDGGAGIDTLKHFGATALTVSLADTGPQNTGLGIDTIRNIENLYGANGNDLLIGSRASNEMRGGRGNDEIEGAAGADTIRGQAGDDTLMGGTGSDALFGDAGNDQIIGGTGNDTMQRGLGNDLLNGGGGIDQLSFSGGGAKRVDLAVTGPQATGEGIDVIIGVERIVSGAGNDYLAGNAAANLFSAGAGNDTLLGRAGADRLIGGDGDDRLDGGTGADILRGDGGVDIFVFVPGDGVDRIQDFQDGNDRIEIGSTVTFDDLTITYDFAENDSRVSVAGTVIVVENLWSGYLTESDFIFA